MAEESKEHRASARAKAMPQPQTEALNQLEAGVKHAVEDVDNQEERA